MSRSVPRQPNRRRIVAGLALLGATPVLAQPLSGEGFDLVPDAAGEQTEALQRAVDAAIGQRRPLHLAAGRYRTRTIRIDGALRLVGVGGDTVLVAAGDGPVLAADRLAELVLADFAVEGGGTGGVSGERGGLIAIANCADAAITRVAMRGSAGNGLVLLRSTARVERCTLSECADTGLFALDGSETAIVDNRVARCGNGGIRVWRSEKGEDGSIVARNHIADIAAAGGGNGQNGNGVNVFRGGGVIVSDNRLSGCAFSAVRLNATDNCTVTGNICTGSGEVAIFSEFGFSGSVIAHNVVDGAATGISITNFDSDGRLATCSGNVVRNITPASTVNPDTVPVGIHVEADTTVSGNVVEAVPGVGIIAGYGPFLRDVAITGNVVRDVEIGIGVSVVENPSPGPVLVSDNLVSRARRYGLVGLAWQDIVSSDLGRDAARFAHLTLGQNSVTLR